MSNQQDERAENLRELLRQHWRECQHIESERAWFMNAYAVVVGGALAFIIGMKSGEIEAFETSVLFHVLIVFIVVFTFFGFFHTLRWTYAFECHRKRVNEFATILWLESGAKVPLDPTMDIPAMHIVPAFTPIWKWKLRMPRCIRNPINEFFRTRFWFPLLYLGILIGLAVLFYGVAGFPSWAKWLAIAFSALALLLGIRWWFSLKGIKKERKIVLEGCNGEWAQKWYFPCLLRKAANGAIELWAVDIDPEIRLNSPGSTTLWHVAQSKGKACYLDKTRDKKTYQRLSNIDNVFVVTPDKYHCEIGKFWLERLIQKGRIFIEKPLDTSVKRAEELRNRANERNIVYCFDHYLARAYPFLKKKTSYLRQIGKITRIDFHILEDSRIPLEKKGTSDKGMIFVLCCHVLAVVCAMVDHDSTSLTTKLPKVELEQVKAAHYSGCPISGETFASIKFMVNNNIEVVSTIGKCVGTYEDKFMKLYGSNGSIKLDFVEDTFSVFNSQGSQQKQGKLNPKHIETFVEEVLMSNKNPLSIPGVLSFDTAFEILTILDKAKKKIGKMPEYQCQETVSEILERF